MCYKIETTNTKKRYRFDYENTATNHNVVNFNTGHTVITTDLGNLFQDIKFLGCLYTFLFHGARL